MNRHVKPSLCANAVLAALLSPLFGSRSGLIALLLAFALLVCCLNRIVVFRFSFCCCDDASLCSIATPICSTLARSRTNGNVYLCAAACCTAPTGRVVPRGKGMKTDPLVQTTIATALKVSIDRVDAVCYRQFFFKYYYYYILLPLYLVGSRCCVCVVFIKMVV